MNSEESESSRLTWWKTYATQLEQKLEGESKKRFEADTLGWSALAVAIFSVMPVSLISDPIDEEWWMVLLLVAFAPFVIGIPVLIVVALVHWVMKLVLRPRREAEFAEEIEESRSWASHRSRYSPTRDAGETPP